MSSPIADIIPVTPTQYGLLYLDRSYSKNTLYHEQYIAELIGGLDLNRLKDAWQKTVNAHSTLRTIFDWDGKNEAVQVVLKNFTAPFNVISTLATDDDRTSFIHDDSQVNFQIDTLSPHRLTIIRINDEKHMLVFTYHHLLLDGSSVSALLNSLADHYNNSSLIASMNNFGEYARWVRGYNQQDSRLAWKDYTKNFEFTPNTGLADTVDMTYEYYQNLGSDTLEELKLLAKNRHLTLNSIFQTIWAYTLSQSKQLSTVCIGSPVIVKPLDGSLDSIVGLCINTIPYIMSFDGNTALIDAAYHHQQAWGRMIEHGRMGLSDIKKAIGYRHYGDPFESIITYTDARDRAVPSIKNIEWQTISHNEVTQYPLSIDVVVNLKSIEIKTTYRNTYYNNEQITDLIQLFSNNITLFVRHPDTTPTVQQATLLKEEVVSGEIQNEDEAIMNTITSVWTSVFETPITYDTNFFDLGGDSISSLRIVSKLREADISISMRDIFDYPTPRLLSGVSSLAEVTAPTTHYEIPHNIIETSDRLFKDNIELIIQASNIQQGILRQPLSRQALYHDQSTFAYQGELNLALFEEAWNMTIKNNEALRMQYFEHDNTWYACVLKERSISLESVDIRAISMQDDVIQKAIRDDLASVFDTKREPLVRLKFFKTSDTTFIIFLSFHVLITDGWSFSFMLDDVFTAYENLLNKNSNKVIDQRKKYTQYLHALDIKDINIGRQYWRNYLQGIELPDTTVGKDFSNLSYVYDQLNERETITLQGYAKSKGLSVNSIVQAAWALTNASRSKPFMFGATASARLLHGVNYDDTIGLFFNDVPIIVSVQDDDIENIARKVQYDFQENLKYSYISSYEIAEILGGATGQTPYVSLVVFENYPKVQEDSLKETLRGGVANIDYWRRDMSDIPITVYIEIRDGVTDVKLSFNRNTITASAAEELVNVLIGTLRSCIL